MVIVVRVDGEHAELVLPRRGGLGHGRAQRGEHHGAGHLPGEDINGKDGETESPAPTEDDSSTSTGGAEGTAGSEGSDSADSSEGTAGTSGEGGSEETSSEGDTSGEAPSLGGG